MDRERESRRAGWRLIGGALRSQTRWVVGGVASGVVWTAAKITIPLLAAAAIDKGILPGDTEAIVMYAVLIVVVGSVQAFGSGLAALRARSASRTGSRPISASGCSPTSSSCTSRSTTKRRPVS